MKQSALLVLSSLLLNTASYAGNTKCDECYDLATKNAAALHYTVSKPNSRETKYWEDYIHSGQKDITVYVRDLSRKDAQAALWFITTGGKHGFAAREATAQERVLLEDAIKQVALSYSQQGVKSGRGLQEWSQVDHATHAGHLHLQMIYKQLDDLKKDNADLKVRVKSLEERVSLLEKTNKKADEEKTAADAKLIAQKTEAEQKLAAQKLADKIAADALLETEKAKVQAEVDRQKARKKVYKDQVIEYKLKAVEAEKAKAVADAVENEKKTAAETLKFANESAAKALKEQQEAAAKEREAAAEREKMLLQRLAALEAIQTNVQTGIGSNTANNNNSSSPFGTRQRSQGAQETRQYDYDFHTTVTETARVDRTATQNR